MDGDTGQTDLNQDNDGDIGHKSGSSSDETLAPEKIYGEVLDSDKETDVSNSEENVINKVEGPRLNSNNKGGFIQHDLDTSDGSDDEDGHINALRHGGMDAFIGDDQGTDTSLDSVNEESKTKKSSKTVNIIIDQLLSRTIDNDIAQSEDNAIDIAQSEDNAIDIAQSEDKVGGKEDAAQIIEVDDESLNEDKADTDTGDNSINKTEMTLENSGDPSDKDLDKVEAPDMLENSDSVVLEERSDAHSGVEEEILLVPILTPARNPEYYPDREEKTGVMECLVLETGEHMPCTMEDVTSPENENAKDNEGLRLLLDGEKHYKNTTFAESDSSGNALNSNEKGEEVNEVRDVSKALEPDDWDEVAGVPYKNLTEDEIALTYGEKKRTGSDTSSHNVPMSPLSATKIEKVQFKIVKSPRGDQPRVFESLKLGDTNDTYGLCCDEENVDDDLSESGTQRAAAEREADVQHSINEEGADVQHSINEEEAEREADVQHSINEEEADVQHSINEEEAEREADVQHSINEEEADVQHSINEEEAEREADVQHSINEEEADVQHSINEEEAKCDVNSIERMIQNRLENDIEIQQNTTDEKIHSSESLCEEANIDSQYRNNHASSFNSTSLADQYFTGGSNVSATSKYERPYLLTIGSYNSLLPSSHVLSRTKEAILDGDVGSSYQHATGKYGGLSTDLGDPAVGSYSSLLPETQDASYHSVLGDTSRLSDRSLLDTSYTSAPSSGPVPGFRTLKEQQANWMQTFHLLEEHHQVDLQLQYKQHQEHIDRVQTQMEWEFLRQQESLNRRLKEHKEHMQRTSNIQSSSDELLSYATSQDYSSVKNSRDYHHDVIGSDIRLNLSTKTKSPVLSYKSTRLFPGESPRDKHRISGDGLSPSRSNTYSSIRKSLEKEFSSPAPSTDFRVSPKCAPRESSLSPTRDVTSTSYLKERNLIGGVYSSPLPISRARGNIKPTQYTPISRVTRTVGSLDHSSPFKNSSMRNEVAERIQDILKDDFLNNSDEPLLTSSLRLNLREKHTKHLADLRSYYENELQDLRTSLTTSEYLKTQDVYKDVSDENHQLRTRCNELEDDLDSEQRNSGALTEKLLNVENITADYLARYEQAKASVSNLQGQMNDLYAYCKEREAIIEDLEMKISKQGNALKESYKIQDEHIESERRDQTTMQRLLDKYEVLEKQNSTLKESVASLENKLYDKHAEAMDMKRTVSKLELENKRIGHDNDVLRYRGPSSSINLSPMDGSYLDSRNGVRNQYGGAEEPVRLQRNMEEFKQRPSSGNKTSSPGLSNRTLNYDDSVRELSVNSGCATPERDFVEKPVSPLIGAERELRKLRHATEQYQTKPEIKLQRKKYDTDVLSDIGFNVASGSFIDAPKSPLKRYAVDNVKVSPVKSKPIRSNKNDISKKDTNSRNSSLLKTPPKKYNSMLKLEPQEMMSPTRFDIAASNTSKKPDPTGKRTEQLAATRDEKRPKASYASVDPAVALTLDKVRSGEFVTRPEWENRDTTTVKGKVQPRMSAVSREENLNDRIAKIQDIEHHYDCLQAEKRKMESALNRIPISGRVDRKSRKEKEMLEENLDQLEKEIGSVRMSLKRYKVLKTSM